MWTAPQGEGRSFSVINVPDIMDYVSLKKTTGLCVDDKTNMYSVDCSPATGQCFPVNKSRLRFQQQWLTQYPRLVYSPQTDGCFCKHCVAFGVEGTGKGGHVGSGKLFSTPYANWKHALEAFKDHGKKKYHIDACVKAEHFEVICKRQADDISVRLDSEKKRQVKENRERMRSIIETILFCGRQEIALREPTENDGNFRALLRFRAQAGDTALMQHINQSTQNEIIDIIGDIIVQKISKKVNTAQCFTVLADEMRDCSGKEQLSVCVRYVDSTQGEGQHVIREDFISFVVMDALTGEAIVHSVEEQLTKAGIDVRFLRGQGYDGVSAMSGRINGAQAKLKERHKHAVYVHCASHSLNLVLNKCCTVQAVRNCFGIVSEVCNFFHDSIQALVPEQKKISAIFTFNELYDPVRSSLEKISDTFSGESSVKASQLLSAIDTAEFILTMTVCEKMLSKTYHLSQFLQKENCDLVSCINAAEDVITQVQKMRSNAEGGVQKDIFKMPASKQLSMTCMHGYFYQEKKAKT
uniref:TTF-type domain-containing protein n=1 Tax=Monopterus albus TaxID=43700 RepID=A0A3Q3KEU8_MONAL